MHFTRFAVGIMAAAMLCFVKHKHLNFISLCVVLGFLFHRIVLGCIDCWKTAI
jgi:hypothetical protein